MFSVPVSFVGFPDGVRRYGPGTSYKVTTRRGPGWTIQQSGYGLDPFLGASPFGVWDNMTGVPVVPRKRPDWTESFVCTGFKPDEVTLKVTTDKAFIHCRHKDGSDDDNCDSWEKKKTVIIPEDVESGDIKAEMSKGGTLTLTAPYIQKEEEVKEVGEEKTENSEKSADSKNEQKDTKSTSRSKSGATEIKISRS